MVLRPKRLGGIRLLVANGPLPSNTLQSSHTMYGWMENKGGVAMLKQPLTDDSPLVIRARSSFGVVAALGTIALTAIAFWSHVQRRGNDAA